MGTSSLREQAHLGETAGELGVRAHLRRADAGPVVRGVAAVRRLPPFVRSHPQSVAYVIVAIALLVYAYRLEQVAQDTNHILKVEVQEKDKQIAALNFVLEQQAIPAVTFMAEEIDRLGGKPPKVLLTPTGPPFVPPARAG